MRQITAHEQRVLEETLNWIKPLFDVEYIYDERQNILMIGDNYIIRGMTEFSRGVERDYFKLIYGSDHPGDDHFDLDRWEEEDVARANSVEPLLPVMVSNMIKRKMEERIYSKMKLASLNGQVCS